MTHKSILTATAFHEKFHSFVSVELSVKFHRKLNRFVYVKISLEIPGRFKLGILDTAQNHI